VANIEMLLTVILRLPIDSFFSKEQKIKWCQDIEKISVFRDTDKYYEIGKSEGRSTDNLSKGYQA
jgi:hypothetical protein